MSSKANRYLNNLVIMSWTGLRHRTEVLVLKQARNQKQYSNMVAGQGTKIGKGRSESQERSRLASSVIGERFFKVNPSSLGVTRCFVLHTLEVCEQN